VTVAGLETIQPAGNLKRVTLELCGKGSRVILDDADLVSTARSTTP
jgi:acyl-CoA reductase-like NAD-dependent aldehyde dehydrogenase